MPPRIPTALTRKGRSAFVGADEFRHREEVARERPLQLRHASAGREPEFLAKGVEPEAVAVTPAPAGWAGAAIADRAEVVAPLQRSPQQVTWSRPITAPSAWFQTGITSGVGSNSTWQWFRAK